MQKNVYKKETELLIMYFMYIIYIIVWYIYTNITLINEHKHFW